MFDVKRSYCSSALGKVLLSCAVLLKFNAPTITPVDCVRRNEALLPNSKHLCSFPFVKHFTWGSCKLYVLLLSLRFCANTCSYRTNEALCLFSLSTGSFLFNSLTNTPAIVFTFLLPFFAVPAPFLFFLKRCMVLNFLMV